MTLPPQQQVPIQTPLSILERYKSGTYNPIDTAITSTQTTVPQQTVPQQTTIVPSTIVQQPTQPSGISSFSQGIYSGAERVASVIETGMGVADIGARRIQRMLPGAVSDIYGGIYQVGRGLVFTGEAGVVRTAGMIPGGVETIARQPEMIPTFVAAGISTQISGLREGVTERPLQTIGEFAVMTAIGEGAGRVVSKGVSIIKSTASEISGIQNISKYNRMVAEVQPTGARSMIELESSFKPSIEEYNLLAREVPASINLGRGASIRGETMSPIEFVPGRSVSLEQYRYDVAERMTVTGTTQPRIGVAQEASLSGAAVKAETAPIRTMRELEQTFETPPSIEGYNRMVTEKVPQRSAYVEVIGGQGYYKQSSFAGLEAEMFPKTPVIEKLSLESSPLAKALKSGKPISVEDFLLVKPVSSLRTRTPHVSSSSTSALRRSMRSGGFRTTKEFDTDFPTAELFMGSQKKTLQVGQVTSTETFQSNVRDIFAQTDIQDIRTKSSQVTALRVKEKQEQLPAHLQAGGQFNVDLQEQDQRMIQMQFQEQLQEQLQGQITKQVTRQTTRDDTTLRMPEFFPGKGEKVDIKNMFAGSSPFEPDSGGRKRKRKIREYTVRNPIADLEDVIGSFEISPRTKRKASRKSSKKRNKRK